MTLRTVRSRVSGIVQAAFVAILAGGATAASAQAKHGFSVEAGYTYTRSNIVPGCACISLNGGSADLQYRVTQHVALFGDLAIVHKGGITPDHYTLTQYTYAGGIRYLPVSAANKLQPFLEAAVGGANVTGTLSPSQTGFGSAHAFTLETGGGLEVRINDRFSVMPARVDYVLTNFANGAQNRQNDLRVSVGVRLRLGHAH